jgi:tetratricopeptide (TPR) repeat protein
MPSTMLAYRVFVASPGGLQEERDAFKKTIDEFNETFAVPRNILFRPIGWEDTLGGVGRPQEIINQDLRSCDYFVMVLFDRWGSKPDLDGRSKFTSGTEEEFHTARECLADAQRPMRQLAVFFKAVDSRRMSDPGIELQKVLDFRKQLEAGKDILYHAFDNVTSFETFLRRFLSRWMLEHEREATGQTALPSSIVPTSSIQADDVRSSPSSESGVATDAQKLADQGMITEAEILFSKALGDGLDPSTLKAYAVFLIRIGRFEQAEGAYRRLLELSRRVGKRWEIDALIGLGRISTIRGNFEEAKVTFREALKIARTLSLPLSIAEVSMELGRLLILTKEKGSKAEASQLIETAVELYAKAGDDSQIAYACNALAILRRDSKPDEAEKLFAKALDLFRAQKNQEGKAKILNNFARLYERQKAYTRAETAYREALKINTELARPNGMALNHANLGRLAWQTGRLEMASEEFQKALELYGSLGLPKKVAVMQKHLERLQKKWSTASSPPISGPDLGISPSIGHSGATGL